MHTSVRVPAPCPRVIWEVRDDEPVAIVQLADLAHITTGTTPTRLESVHRAHREGVELPPIKLLPGPPFVLVDGNHRLTAARALGLQTITAHISPNWYARLLHEMTERARSGAYEIRKPPVIRRYQPEGA